VPILDGPFARWTALRLDGSKHEQIAGDRRFLSPGYAGAADRYEIEILGGASEVKIAGV